jgi:hypothetical protein
MGNLQAKCPVCWGVGFTGGYYMPVLCYAIQEGMSQGSDNTQPTGRQQEQHLIYKTTSAYGLVSPGDYIRELETPNKLYYIQSITNSTFNNRPVTYRLNCQEAESGAALYLDTFPTPFDPEVIRPNAFFMTIEKDYERVSNIFKDSYIRHKNAGAGSSQD